MTPQEIRKYARKIQKSWGLGNWKLKVKLVKDLMINEAIHGDIDWSCEYHTVTMRLDPEMPDKELMGTVRHEMLHLRLEGHKPCKSTNDPMYEHALNQIADAYPD